MINTYKRTANTTYWLYQEHNSVEELSGLTQITQAISYMILSFWTISSSNHLNLHMTTWKLTLKNRELHEKYTVQVHSPFTMLQIVNMRGNSCLQADPNTAVSIEDRGHSICLQISMHFQQGNHYKSVCDTVTGNLFMTNILPNLGRIWHILINTALIFKNRESWSGLFPADFFRGRPNKAHWNEKASVILRKGDQT